MYVLLCDDPILGDNNANALSKRSQSCLVPVPPENLSTMTICMYAAIKQTDELVIC